MGRPAFLFPIPAPDPVLTGPDTGDHDTMVVVVATPDPSGTVFYDRYIGEERVLDLGTEDYKDITDGRSAGDAPGGT